MANIMKLMKQAADMQKNMAKAQEELSRQEVEFSAGGGSVVVKAYADGNICGLQISPDVLKIGDPEMIEDLILSAVRGAQDEARRIAGETMGKLTAGMDLPPGMGF